MKRPGWHRRTAATTGMVMAMLLAAPAVAAQTNADASNLEARYQEGAALRQRQQDVEALAVFRSIYEQTRQYRALAQVGLAEGALGHWLEAERCLAEALSSADPWIASRRSTLDGALATIRTHLGTLEVNSPTADAQVWVDGTILGIVNRSHRVLAGTVHFEVRARGYRTVSRIATVPVAGLARESVALTVVEAAPEPAAAPAPPAVPTPLPTPLPMAATSTERPAPEGTRRGLAIGALALGGTLAVGGLVAWAYGWTQVSAYNDDPACPLPGAGMAPPDCQSRLNTLGVIEPLGWTGMIGGALLLATGAVLWATSPSPRRERALRMGPGPGQLGASMQWEF